MENTCTNHKKLHLMKNCATPGKKILATTLFLCSAPALPCTFDTQHLLSQHCFLSPLILFPDSALSDLSLPISCILPIPCPHSIDCRVSRKRKTHYQICTQVKILMIVIIEKMMSKKLLRCCYSVLIYHTIY